MFSIIWVIMVKLCVCLFVLASLGFVVLFVCCVLFCVCLIVCLFWCLVLCF